MAVTLRAWDAFGNQLRIEAMRESWTDSRRELAEVTRRVIRSTRATRTPSSSGASMFCSSIPVSMPDTRN